MKTVRRPPYPKWNPGYFPCSSLTPPSAFLKPSFGGFGLNGRILGMKPVGVGLHQQDAMLPACVHHLSGLKGIAGQGLLAQDVLTSLGGRDIPLPVQAVGQRNIDGLDVRVVQQLPVAPISPVYIEFLGKLLGPLKAPAGL